MMMIMTILQQTRPQRYPFRYSITTTTTTTAFQGVLPRKTALQSIRYRTTTTTTTTTTPFQGRHYVDKLYRSNSNNNQNQSLIPTTPVSIISNTTLSSSSSSPFFVSSDVNNNTYEQYYHCFFDRLVPDAGRCVGIQLVTVPNDHLNSLQHRDLLLSLTSSSSPFESSSSWSLDNTDHSSSSNDHDHEHDHHRHWLCQYLHPDEIQYGLQLHHMNHRQSFYMGRLAIRHALQQRQQEHSSDTTTTTKSSQKETIHQNIHGNDNDDDDDRNEKASTTSSIRNSILKDMYGRPKLPPGYLGSISHKGVMGVALVREEHRTVSPHQDVHSSSFTVLPPVVPATPPPQMGIGVDIEDISDAYRRRHVARKVLTPNEIQNLGTLSACNHPKDVAAASSRSYLSIEEEILLRFSCKESVYKAIHPLLNQYVSFHEAEIQPYINGTATVTLNLVSSDRTKRLPKLQQQLMTTPISLHWYRYDNYIITTASIRLQQ